MPQPDGLSAGSATNSKQDSAYEALRSAILSKRLPAESRLPSTRTLAQRWSLSRGTLEIVFDRLASEGYVVRVSGSGTRVCAVVPDKYLAADDVSAHGAVSTKAEVCVVEVSAEVSVQAGLPFVARQADPALFPIPVWSRAMARAMTAMPAQMLALSDAMGLLDLREQIADYLGKYRGIRCDAANIIITTGIRHALDLIARSLIIPGDAVCLEDPGYPSAERLFAMAGARLLHIPVTEDGIDDAQLRQHSDVRLAYVTPAHQSPLGVTLSVSRRLGLLDWASQTGAWVVEDDYDSEFNYNSAPLAALKALDKTDRVIYCGSFNKTLFVGLRVGFMLVPAALRGQLLTTLQTTGRSVGVTEQATLSEFIRNGAFVRHLRAARQAYQQRRDVLLECLAEHAPGCYTVSGQHAGLHFVLGLPEGTDETRFCERAKEVGLVLQPISQFCQTVKLPPSVMIGFTALTLAQVRYNGRKLARLLVGG